MPFGPFALQWTAPSPNPPTPTPLPPNITRSFITTASGPLELLTALPPASTSSTDSKPPLFFAHGGFGCAAVWLAYMHFFAVRGYPCYALSYRGHGGSWYPSLPGLYITTLETMGEDLLAGVSHVETLETSRRGAEERVRVVLVAHSAGGALSQYVLSRGLVAVRGLCLLAAVPGFGSVAVYGFWTLSVPFHFPYRGFHPRYVLADTRQVHDAFFTPETPTTVVRALENLLSPYESMLWPVQTLFQFVTGPDVLSSITGWGTRTSSLTKDGHERQGVEQRLLVLAAEKDVLCTPAILLDAAQRYRAAFRDLVKSGKVDGVSENHLRGEEDTEQGTCWDGVGFKVVKGLGHHLQNHEEWKIGAREILEWVEQV